MGWRSLTGMGNFEPGLLQIVRYRSRCFLVGLDVIVVRFTLCEAVSAYMRVARKVSD